MVQSNVKPVVRKALFNASQDNRCHYEGGVLKLDFGLPLGKSVNARYY